MTNIKLYIASLTAVLAVASCGEDDYNAPTPTGNPVATATAPTATLMMGETLELDVNCTDNSGQALSTLKAELSLSGEVVSETTMRTKTEGTYRVELSLPYLQHVPDGQADIVLTLQNVTTKTATSTVKVNVARPHFTDLFFVTSDGARHAMTEQTGFVYTASFAATRNSFKGHFETADGRFLFGSDGNTGATLGNTTDLTFTTAQIGQVAVTFNAQTYSFGPQEELNITPIDFTDTETGKVWTGTVAQNALCAISAGGADLTDEWYYDPDFFSDNGDGTFNFKAVGGKYCITADFTNKGLRIYKMADGTDSPETLAADGSGSLWIIGSEGINKPTWSAVNHGWWTGVESDICMAQISDKVHQITLTIGQQLDAKNVNFKFYGQPDWGTEFKGSGGSYSITSTSNIFMIGDGTEDAEGVKHDDGNVYIAGGVTLTEGDTYVLTVDLTNGPANAVMSVEKK